MADDGKISFLLDLDVAEFTEKGLQAKGIIEKLGGEESVAGLLEGLTKAGVILGTVGLAAFAFKKALDLTVEGEEIERINHQFETLSTQAGIVPEKLKMGLEASAKGLVDTDDLLKIANESIVKMGGSADKLPEIMNIAMKATQVYGGDAKTNFENISTAIANGNTRLLKHYGIIIDAAKAEKEFADANGTTADQLSEVGKRQAILNAALAEGGKGFKDIEVNTKSAKNILESLKVTFKEIGETVTLVFEKTVGPTVRNFLGTVETWAKKFHVLIKDEFEGSAKDAHHALQGVQDKTKENEKVNQQAQEAAMALAKKASQESIIDQEKAKKNQLAFRKELEKIDKEYFAAQQNNVRSMAQVDALVKKNAEMLEKDHQNRLQQIRNNASLNATQKKQLLSMEDQRYKAIRENDAQTEEKLKEKLLDDYVKHSDNAFQGISRAAQQSAIKSKAYLQDFGKQGQEVMQGFSSYSTQAFESMGQAAAQGQDVAGAAAEAMKKMFLNVIADRAVATGSALLLEGLWPPNPIALGAGAGLIALGGALRTLGGGSGGTVGGAVGGGVGTSGIGVASPSPSQTGSGASLSPASASDASATATNNMAQQQQVQRTVQVNIAGNYLETDQTKRMLMDLMRQESDATGFNYNQIGA